MSVGVGVGAGCTVGAKRGPLVPLYLPYISRISPIYLPYISVYLRISSVYLPYISPLGPSVVLSCPYISRISPVFLPYISRISPLYLAVGPECGLFVHRARRHRLQARALGAGGDLIRVSARDRARARD